jgi:putative transposase
MACRSAFAVIGDKQEPWLLSPADHLAHAACMFQRHPVQNQRLMFVTTNAHRRRRVFADPACARQAVESLYRVQCFRPFLLHGFVVMPDHCHFLLWVPEKGSVSAILHAYKRAVAFEVGESIWQSRFHLRIIRNAERVLRYIHENPVKAALCRSSEEYPWSSASGRWDVSALV